MSQIPPPAEQGGRRSEGWEISEVRALLVPQQTPSVIYAGTGRGLFRSEDGGASWTKHSDDTIYCLAGATDGSVVYAGGGRGVVRTSNAGRTWSTLALGGPVLSIGITEAAKAVYAGTADGVYRSGDQGESWAAVLRRPGKAVVSIAVDRAPLLIGTESAVYRSDDAGQSWELVGAGLPVAHVCSLAVLDRNHLRILAGTEKGLFMYDRTGRWVMKKEAGVSPVYAIRAGLRSASTYAAVWGRGIYRSTDGGVSWSAIGAFPNARAIELTTAGKLYVGTVTGILSATEDNLRWSKVVD